MSGYFVSSELFPLPPVPYELNHRLHTAIRRPSGPFIPWGGIWESQESCMASSLCVCSHFVEVCNSEPVRFNICCATYSCNSVCAIIKPAIAVRIFAHSNVRAVMSLISCPHGKHEGIPGTRLVLSAVSRATFELSMHASSCLPSASHLFQIKGCGRVTGYRHTLFRPSPSYGNSRSSRCPSPSVTAPPHLLTTRNHIQAFTSSMTYIPPDEDDPTPEAPIMIA